MNNANNIEPAKVTKQNDDSDARQRLMRPSNTSNNNEMPTPPEVLDCADNETEADCALPTIPPQANCVEDESGETNCEAPEIPGGEFGGPMDGELPWQMTDSVNINNEAALHPVAYLSLGAGSVVLSITIIYTCISGFFHKKPAAIFSTWQKFAWFVLATIALSAALIALCYFVPIWIN